MKRLLVAAAMLVSVLTCQLAAATTASAHAVLESSSPAAGENLDRIPTEVVFIFSETVGRPAAVTVTAPDGEAIQVGDAVVVDDTLRQDVGADGAVPGAYTIAYEVKSADGHPISGTSSFTVGGSDVPMVSDTTTDDGAPDRRAVLLLLAVTAAALAAAVSGAHRTARSLSETASP